MLGKSGWCAGVQRFAEADERSTEARFARSDFVYVADDGSARELTAREAEYLATSFDAGDGGRPYVKRYYDSRTPEGRLLGFLPRGELPAQVRVQQHDS